MSSYLNLPSSNGLRSQLHGPCRSCIADRCSCYQLCALSHNGTRTQRILNSCGREHLATPGPSQLLKLLSRQSSGSHCSWNPGKVDLKQTNEKI